MSLSNFIEVINYCREVLFILFVYPVDLFQPATEELSRGTDFEILSLDWRSTNNRPMTKILGILRIDHNDATNNN